MLPERRRNGYGIRSTFTTPVGKVSTTDMSFYTREGNNESRRPFRPCPFTHSRVSQRTSWPAQFLCPERARDLIIPSSVCWRGEAATGAVRRRPDGARAGGRSDSKAKDEGNERFWYTQCGRTDCAPIKSGGSGGGGEAWVKGGHGTHTPHMSNVGKLVGRGARSRPGCE